MPSPFEMNMKETIPGWHMNKKHWITVYLDGSLKIALVKELILNSYDLVKLQIKKTKKANLKLQVDVLIVGQGLAGSLLASS